MSLPRSLHRPSGCYLMPVPTRRGPLAAIRIDPPAGVAQRPDVLLVPGFTGSKEDFLPVLHPLAAAGYRVTAIDLRGQLDSAALDSAALDSAALDSAAFDRDGMAGESAYSVAALAGDLGDVLGTLGRPAHLLGHSFGGLVARYMALTESPEGLRSLTLLGSGPAAIPPPAADRLSLLRPVLDSGGVPAVWAAAQALEAAEPGYVAPAPEIAAFLRRRYLAMPAACLGGMARGLLDEPDRVTDLAATGVPVLVAHGVTDDAWPPSVQREMARRLGARYAAVPDSVHSPATENPSATADILLAFWASTEAVPGRA